MWAYRVSRPGIVERTAAPNETLPLVDGQVRLRLRAAGLCGSDMPRLNGAGGPRYDGEYGTAPVHEVVGEVVESASPELGPGQRVVGTLGPHGGLAELMVASASMLVPVPEELPDVDAVTIQPLGTVLRAAAKFPDTTGLRAAVLGTGPIGLAFCHVLKRRGIAHLSAIDPIERSGTAKAFGADDFYHMPSAEWLKVLRPEDRPQVVVEAVGHQQGTVTDAINSVDDHGYIFGFGEPGEANYTVPYGQLYLKDVTLASGCTIGGWPKVLTAGAEYLLRHRADFARYISHVVPVNEAQKAYSLYANPQVGRIKVVIVP